ncbi:MAG: hypothetical protein WCJ64_14085 [Rhodospirillaceae bacterium]
MQELERDYHKFVGFYWTLPLPQFGFTRLPADAAEAARVSRTIRYQRELAHRHVAEQKGVLVGEFVFLELREDRPSEAVQAELTKALKTCLAHDAQLIFVDFAAGDGGWRNHPFLFRLTSSAPVSCLGLLPEPIELDGSSFDPISHFRSSRAAGREGASRDERRAALAGLVADVLASIDTATTIPTYSEIAQRLNCNGTLTLGGRDWTAGNIKQFMRTNRLGLRGREA